MRRLILASILTAGLALPGLASAVPPTGQNTGDRVGAAAGEGTRTDRPLRPHNGVPGGSVGGGMVGGNEPGHVDSPGVTKIDPDSRGPINDVQPGRGTDDTRQSKNPKPAR